MTGHRPVLLDEVIAALAPRAGRIYVDGTFGAGGYSRALLDAADCTVLAIDRDPAAIAGGAALAERAGGRLTLIEGRFGEMDVLVRARGVESADGIALDVGVSSMQLDDAARGFAFAQDGPLDMRMERAGETAADVVNRADVGVLADIIYSYGEERRARQVARAIVAARTKAPIERTGRLAEIVRGAVGPSRGGIDPATRTFQALRVHVNDELGELDRGLAAAERLLRPGGRLAVVSFHSLEDRRVKTFLRTRSGGDPKGSRHLPERRASHDPTFTLLTRRAVRPSSAEVAANPRARSARLRWAERTAAPAWPAAATHAFGEAG